MKCHIYLINHRTNVIFLIAVFLT